MKLLRELITETQVVEDSATKQMYLTGLCVQSTIRNQNGRIYPKPVLEKQVGFYNENFIKTGRAMGECMHPDSPQINLDRVSHLFTEVKQDGNNWWAKARLLNTPCGVIVQELCRGGASLGFSSRGMGSLVESAEGNIVQEDFEFVTLADIVANPSAPDCWTQSLMEGRNWIREGGIYKEVQMEAAQKAIRNASSRTLEEVKQAAFVQFINSFRK